MSAASLLLVRMIAGGSFYRSSPIKWSHAIDKVGYSQTITV
ncbi:MAG: hypothetical protein NZ959_01760 [Armatimonadetes bacterium]|nr:hypothetical protein [Armatimonadota bacterium]MDW8121387.1 hypothetical protein [Armatimonadota bacterium]